MTELLTTQTWAVFLGVVPVGTDFPSCCLSDVTHFCQVASKDGN